METYRLCYASLGVQAMYPQLNRTLPTLTGTYPKCHCLYMQFKHNFTFTFTTFVGLNEHNVYMCLKHKILCYDKKEILCEMSPNANIRKKCSDTNYKDEEKHTTNDNYIRILYMGSCYLKYIVSR